MCSWNSLTNLYQIINIARGLSPCGDYNPAHNPSLEDSLVKLIQKPPWSSADTQSKMVVFHWCTKFAGVFGSLSHGASCGRRCNPATCKVEFNVQYRERWTTIALWITISPRLLIHGPLTSSDLMVPESAICCGHMWYYESDDTEIPRSWTTAQQHATTQDQTITRVVALVEVGAMH